MTGMNELILGQYVCFMFGATLQDSSDMMSDIYVQEVSLAFDPTTHREQSFFDICVRLCFKGLICNIHLFGLPMFD